MVTRMTADQHDPEMDRLRHRLRGFGIHMAVYVVAMIVLVPVNLMMLPETIWFPFPMVGWGCFLAIHVAYVMGLFDRSADGTGKG